MSNFQPASTALQSALVRANEDRIMVAFARWNTTDPNVSQDSFGDAVLWPRSRMCSCDVEISLFGMCWTDRGQYEAFPPNGGSQGQYKIYGACLDVNGNPVSGAQVRLFRTSDDRHVGDVVTAVDGTFIAYTPYPGVNHYVVCYLAGGTDIAGTSANTLSPTA